MNENSIKCEKKNYENFQFCHNKIKNSEKKTLNNNKKLKKKKVFYFLRNKTVQKFHEQKSSQKVGVDQFRLL